MRITIKLNLFKIFTDNHQLTAKNLLFVNPNISKNYKREKDNAFIYIMHGYKDNNEQSTHEENPSPYIVRKDMDVNEHEENPSPYIVRKDMDVNEHERLSNT
jgi:hypothetical protein